MDGIGVQYESEMIYHNMLKELEDKNVIFTSIDDAIRNYSDFASAMYKFESGETVEVKLMRLSQGTYKEMSINVVLAGAQ